MMEMRVRAAVQSMTYCIATGAAFAYYQHLLRLLPTAQAEVKHGLMRALQATGKTLMTGQPWRNASAPVLALTVVSALYQHCLEPLLTVALVSSSFLPNLFPA